MRDYEQEWRQIQQRDNFMLAGVILGLLFGTLLGYVWKGTEAPLALACGETVTQAPPPATPRALFSDGR